MKAEEDIECVWTHNPKKEKNMENIYMGVVVYLLSCVRLFATLWTVARRAPLSLEFFRQEYWSRLLFPSPGDLPDPGIEPMSPMLQADSLPPKPPVKPATMSTQQR